MGGHWRFWEWMKWVWSPSDKVPQPQPCYAQVGAKEDTFVESLWVTNPGIDRLIMQTWSTVSMTNVTIKKRFIKCYALRLGCKVTQRILAIPERKVRTMSK